VMSEREGWGEEWGEEKGGWKNAGADGRTH
jgi:hypothetical protein